MIPTITNECGQFLELSNQKPLVKMLPIQGDGFRRVKVRKKDWDSSFVSSFNNAFNDYKNLLQRSVLAKAQPDIEPNKEAFYIFPTDGFRFMYSLSNESSKNHYEQLFIKLTECVKEKSVDIFMDVVRSQYLTENIEVALDNNYELIIYDIAYYYAIRKSIVDDYVALIYDI